MLGGGHAARSDRSIPARRDGALLWPIIAEVLVLASIPILPITTLRSIAYPPLWHLGSRIGTILRCLCCLCCLALVNLGSNREEHRFT